MSEASVSLSEGEQATWIGRTQPEAESKLEQMRPIHQKLLQGTTARSPRIWAAIVGVSLTVVIGAAAVAYLSLSVPSHSVATCVRYPA